MILSVSRRTDIPAHFSRWFSQCLSRGIVKVGNPFNPHQVSTISLSPEDVTAFVFWTRNSQPFLPVVQNQLKNHYRFYFLYTLTPYQFPLETNLPSVKTLLSSLQQLSTIIGSDKVIWRYDPIIISDHTDFTYHLSKFEGLASALENYTQRVIISFLDFYKKTIRNLRPLEEQNWKFHQNPEILTGFKPFLKELKAIADRHQMEITSCSEKIDFSDTGIMPGSCVDVHLLNRLYSLNLTYRKDPHQRPKCLCAVSKDIGTYNTCSSGCLYCYANK